MFYLKIGLRNIVKDYKRSLVTMIAIMVGMTACLLTQGFFNWNMNQLKESTIHSGIGHFQLYRSGFSEFGNDNPYQYLINNPTPILKELRSIPEIDTVTTRMAFSGIISSSAQSAVVMGEAGNPENEAKLNSESGLLKGAGLNSKAPNEVVVGDGVARKLAVKIGDTLTLMGNMQDGGINAVDLRLVGITHSGYPDLDNISANTSLSVIQNLLNTDHQVQKIVILLKNTNDTAKIFPQIKRICQKYRLEYKDWQTLAEFYGSLKLMFDAVFIIIMVIILLIITFTISNTVNMSLNERFREIGTIRALGTKRLQVALIFIIESMFNGVIGSIIGLFISCIFIGVTEISGGLPVVIRSNGQSNLIHVFFHPDVMTIITCLGLFTFVAGVASILPARKASKIFITEALRWV